MKPARMLPAVTLVAAVAPHFAVAVDAPPDPWPIRLTVRDSLGVERGQEPVCSGIPFARGVLQPDQPVHVETADGRSLLTQTRVLGTWPDASVKWMLVQFFADCPAGGERVYHLARGPSPVEARTLMIEQSRERIRVDTGAMRTAVPRDRLALLDDVAISASGPRALRNLLRPIMLGGTVVTFMLADGSTHTAATAKPESVTLEENGPVRATIRVVGWLAGSDGQRRYKLDTRLRFYAGQPFVYAAYTFTCLGQPELHEVKRIALDLTPVPAGGTRYVLPGDPDPTRGMLASDDTSVVCINSELEARVGMRGKLHATNADPLGWGLLRLPGDGSIGVALRDFRHLAPKAIELAPNRIRLALWDDRDGDVLRLGRTRARTHHVLIHFERETGTPDRVDRLVAFHEPLVATVSPEYFCTTDAFGPLSPSGVPETALYDERVHAAFAALREQRETLPRENGMLHYGDYYHGGYGNRLTRGDLEYDTGHACFLQYARTGRRDYFDFAVACNQHFIDIDVNQETGDQRFHGYGDQAETHEEVTTSMEWGHLFVDCCADAYYLTGDERSLEALRMISDRVATIADGNGYEKIRSIFAGAERQLGWPLQVLCRAYQVTGEKKYLEAADKVVALIKLYAKDPLDAYRTGTWWRCWMMDGCKLFMTGQLHDGLNAYYEITHDPEMRAAIVTSLDWLIDNMWNPEMDGFVYEFNAMNRGHRREGMTGLNLLGVDAFRAGYEMTGSNRYLAVAVRAFWAQVREMGDDVDGKNFSINTRTSPHTAAWLHRKHIMPDDLPKAPPNVRQQTGAPPVLPRPAVLLRAAFDDDLSCETPAGTATGGTAGSTAFVPGVKGKAIAVGNGGYAWLPAPPTMLRQPGSIELWVRLHFRKQPKTPGQRAIFHVEGPTPLIDSLAACTIYSELRVRMKDHVGHLHGTAEGEIAAWEPNEWHHVVVTWDDTRVRLYLDGVEQTRDDEGEKPGDRILHLSPGPQTRINLGWRFGNWYCDCAIDELVVHGRALSSEEIGRRPGE